MKLRIRNEQKVRIEMLPLIDVVFLLLVFFIYAMLAMSVHRGLPVDLPDSVASVVEKNQTLAVTLKANGQIFINQSSVLLSRLEVSLKNKVEDQHSPNVLLFADNQLTYQEVFAVMDKIKQAGIHKISLQADQVTRQ